MTCMLQLQLQLDSSRGLAAQRRADSSVTAQRLLKFLTLECYEVLVTAVACIEPGDGRGGDCRPHLSISNTNKERSFSSPPVRSRPAEPSWASVPLPADRLRPQHRSQMSSPHRQARHISAQGTATPRRVMTVEEGPVEGGEAAAPVHKTASATPNRPCPLPLAAGLQSPQHAEDCQWWMQVERQCCSGSGGGVRGRRGGRARAPPAVAAPDPRVSGSRQGPASN
eukprot:CAMPEP_0114480304 /NCGR_PEP_ID=MMETSP0104-20121206/17057_1 /TAXON_ID=37642 ORGANISM="Paraphysomonas imperforata, Strain PA2" /NCGR_SAMPLE_ID=MMETSP0104 /ASSEMBLY_ACC=CAM_ASM_000202 /LENGTH=224 /DNA_ID=CAMNT_0001655773 /DNA_START=640 /DNA_END=1315 /DNA_ORIENTATION=-